jgi:hypothetical protein
MAHALVFIQPITLIKAKQIGLIEPRVVENEPTGFTLYQVHAKWVPVPNPFRQEWRDQGAFETADWSVANHAIANLNHLTCSFLSDSITAFSKSRLVALNLPHSPTVRPKAHKPEQQAVGPESSIAIGKPITRSAGSLLRLRACDELKRVSKVIFQASVR